MSRPPPSVYSLYLAIPAAAETKHSIFVQNGLDRLDRLDGLDGLDGLEGLEGLEGLDIWVDIFRQGLKVGISRI